MPVFEVESSPSQYTRDVRSYNKNPFGQKMQHTQMASMLCTSGGWGCCGKGTWSVGLPRARGDPVNASLDGGP